MHLSIFCPQCNNSAQFVVPLKPQNDCVYKIECPQGHSFRANVLHHHFQLLFEIAAHAIVDGYPREAISSFSASHERFMEWFVKTVCLVREITPQDFERAWKEVSRQSERQLGAYVFCHLVEFRVAPPIVSGDFVALRNRVIHQGVIPSSAEVIAYGNEVLRVITSGVSSLWNSLAHQKEAVRSINDRGDFSPSGPKITLLPYAILGTNRPISTWPTDVSTVVANIRCERDKGPTSRNEKA